MILTQNTKKEKSRNQKIIERFFSSEKRYSVYSIANEFHISPTRVWQIIRDYKKKQGEKNDII